MSEIDPVTLKPCPFCGCREVMISYAPRSKMHLMIRCPVCRANFEASTKGKINDHEAMAKAYHKLVELWNRRPLDTEDKNK